jgi:hypothetical protein
MGVSNDGDRSIGGIYSKIHSININFFYIPAIFRNLEAPATLKAPFSTDAPAHWWMK